jgi:threonine dehydrogenase-like Zn-dependent dehydrogenase
MKALCWHGTGDVRVDYVPDPRIVDPGDAIVRVTATAICGSDLHLFDGFMPTMREGDILGHELMGEVVEIGNGVTKLKKGDQALTVKTGQTHVPRYYVPLLKKIQVGEIDPSFVITHRPKLEEGPAAYKTFRDKQDGCIKVVLKPWA